MRAKRAFVCVGLMVRALEFDHDFCACSTFGAER